MTATDQHRGSLLAANLLRQSGGSIAAIAGTPPAAWWRQQAHDLKQ